MIDYKKKYEESIERMKSWVRGEHPECFTEAQKAAEFVFPELKKSEDDKIREWIINYLEVRLPDAGEFLDEYVRAIDWLKRKGESKSVEWSEEDEKIYEDIVDTVDNDLSLYWKHRNWIRDIKTRIQPQPTKLSAEDAKMIDDIINDIDIAYERACIEQLKDIYSKEIDLLKRIKEQRSWKPEEKQMMALLHAIGNAKQRCCDKDGDRLQSLYNDLEKLI